MLNRILIVVTIILTFLLINLGGHVHNTGSSLACPDWPLCYGQIMPLMKGGVLIEHSHRLLGSLVGLLTLIMVFTFRDTKNKKTAFWALLMVIIQGILGGLTVIFKLPPLISTAHLSLSMVFFCTLIYMHHKFHSSFIRQRADRLVNITLIILYLQIVLGALIRHLGLGIACGVGSENSITCSNPLSPPTILHMSHRLLGGVTGILVISMTIKLLKKNFSFISVILLSLLGIQLWLGTKVVSSGLRPFITMLHLSAATLLLGVIWKIRLKQTLL